MIQVTNHLQSRYRFRLGIRQLGGTFHPGHRQYDIRLGLRVDSFQLGPERVEVGCMATIGAVFAAEKCLDCNLVRQKLMSVEGELIRLRGGTGSVAGWSKAFEFGHCRVAFLSIACFVNG